MKKTTLIITLFAAMLFAACGGEQKKNAGEPNDTTEQVTPDAEEQSDSAEETVAEEESKDYKGELGLFELRGPVKSCTYTNKYATVKRTFDENGYWLTYDGKKLSTVYPSGIKRDKNGRITKGIMDGDGNCETYTYNEDGSKKSYVYSYFDSVSKETCTYDEEGNLMKRHVEDYGMDGEEPYTETYEVLETDEHGNWTKRKVKGGPLAGNETRKIVYY